MATDADVQIAHLIDDLETVRTHPIRTIQNVDPLLTLAMAALENGDLEVVREYLDRSRNALTNELRWLRSAATLRDPAK